MTLPPTPHTPQRRHVPAHRGRTLLVFRAALPPAQRLGLVGCGGGDGPAIDAVAQTIAFGPAPVLSLHETATVVATATSGLTVSYSSQTPAVCSVDAVTGQVTALAPGDCIIAAGQSGDDHFAPARTVTQSLTIRSLRAQTLRFATPPSLTLHGLATVSATASSGLTVSYTSQTPSLCAVQADSGLVTSRAAGDCQIVAVQAGNDDYDAAESDPLTLTVAADPGAARAPGAPEGVSARLVADGLSAQVSLTTLQDAGRSPITGFKAVSVPSGLSVTGTQLPLTVPCPSGCAGYRFAVQALNAQGTGAASEAADIITRLQVRARFFEPDTQPNDTIFTGSFTFNTSSGRVSALSGRLTESMTGSATAPMTEIRLTHQRSAVSDGAGGLLVSSFALNATDTFWPSGFSDTANGLYFGYPAPYDAATANSFITLDIPLANPLAPATTAQIQRLTYGDCAPGGMMGAACMTGMVGGGTMGGYPVEQVITLP